MPWVRFSQPIRSMNRPSFNVNRAPVDAVKKRVDLARNRLARIAILLKEHLPPRGWNTREAERGRGCNACTQGAVLASNAIISEFLGNRCGFGPSTAPLPAASAGPMPATRKGVDHAETSRIADEPGALNGRERLRPEGALPPRRPLADNSLEGIPER